jgi:dephospho-CoA kinase
VPLLVGSPLLQFVDRVLVVDCKESTQIQRLMARDTETVEQAQKILSTQASRSERLAIADDIIDSEQGLDDMRGRVRNLDESYRRLARPPDPPARSPENS